MPRGWLKHKSRRVGKKASRGGSSYQSSKGQQNQRKVEKRSHPMRHSKPHRASKIQERDSCGLIEEESWINDHDFSTHEEQLYLYSSNKDQIQSRARSKNVEKLCPICCEIRPLHSLMKKCNHPPICRECLHEIYVSQAQQNVSNYPLQCYHPECSKPVLATQLIHLNIFRSDEELQKHHRFSLLAKAYSHSNKMIVHCPDCDFPKLVINQNKAYCRKCKNRYDVAYDPNHNKASTIQALKAIRKDSIGYNEGWTYCPGCKMIVSKGEGCNHMICVCGEEFYWNEITVDPSIKMAVAERVSLNSV